MSKSTKSSAYLIGTIKNYWDCNRWEVDDSYQRTKVWNSSQKSALIYSILDNCPIGEFQVVNTVPYHYDIVDGYQRITTLVDFMNGLIKMNSADSKKIIDRLYSDFSTKSALINKWKAGRSIRLKWSDLPIRLQEEISNYEVNVKMLIDWPEQDIRDYFLRVQNGTPLTTNDRIWTVDTPITQRVKAICHNRRYLSNLGLIFENGTIRKSAERKLIGILLEALYCSAGRSINTPSKLVDYYTQPENHNSERMMADIDKLEAFLESLDVNDRPLFRTSFKTDLLLVFCLVLFGKWPGDIKDHKKFIINIASVTASVFVHKIKGKNKGDDDPSKKEMYDELYSRNLFYFYKNAGDVVDEFSALRQSGHGQEKVQTLCQNVSNRYIQTHPQLQTS